MAVTITPVLAGTDEYIADIEATQDADTGGDITHGLGAAPLEVYITPLLAAAHVSAWYASVINSTIVTMTCGTTAGSGASGNQVRVIIKRPHSIGK